jgi:PIN domain nuclease of toxin-antitoxin system
LKYLLDTHTFLWMAGELASLSTKVLNIIKESNNQLLLSAASGWEIAMLQQLNRVELPDSPQRFVPEAMQMLRVLPIPIGFTTAISAALLPLIHRDPFDRIIIAEALKQKIIVLTKDKQFLEYGVRILW